MLTFKTKLALLVMAVEVLLLMMTMITTFTNAEQDVESTKVNGSEIVEGLIKGTRFVISMALLPPPTSALFAIISGPTSSADPMEIKGSLLYLQPLSSMSPGSPVFGDGGRLLKEIYPDLVSRFESRLSNLGVMCTEKADGGGCFLFMASKEGGKDKKKKPMMLTFELKMEPKSAAENQESFCSLPMDHWAETIGKQDLLLLLFPFDAPRRFFSFNTDAAGHGKIVYSVSDVKIKSGCPHVTGQSLTTRYLCSTSTESADGWVSRKACPKGQEQIFGNPVAGFVLGGRLYQLASGSSINMISMPMAMFEVPEKTMSWKIESVAYFWRYWRPPEPGPEPLPLTDGTTIDVKTSSTTGGSSITTTSNSISSSSSEGNSKLLLHILLIIVLVVAIVAGVLLFWCCCSSRKRKKNQEKVKSGGSKRKKKKPDGKKALSSKVDGKSKSSSVAANQAASTSKSDAQPAKTESFFLNPSKSNAAAAGKSASKPLASTASEASKATTASKVTVRSKQTTKAAGHGQSSSSLPRVDKMASTAENSIMTDAHRTTTSTSRQGGKSTSRPLPTTRSKSFQT